MLRKEKSERVRGTKGRFYQHKSEIPPAGQKSQKVHRTSGSTCCSSGTPGKQPRLPEPAGSGSTGPSTSRTGAGEEFVGSGTVPPARLPLLTAVSRQKPPMLPSHSQEGGSGSASSAQRP